MGRTGSFDWNRVTALASMTIAIIALAVSVWQGIETRENYRLSVRPNLEARIVWAHEPAGSTRLPGLYVANVGIGPAVVTSVSVSVSGAPVAIQPQRRLAGSLLDSLSLPPELPMELSDLGVVGAGGEVPVIRIALPGYTEDQRLALAEELGKISIAIEYDSMYGEHFSAAFGDE